MASKGEQEQMLWRLEFKDANRGTLGGFPFADDLALLGSNLLPYKTTRLVYFNRFTGYR